MNASRRLSRVLDITFLLQFVTSLANGRERVRVALAVMAAVEAVDPGGEAMTLTMHASRIVSP